MSKTSRLSADVPVAVKRAFHRAVIGNETDMTSVLVDLMTAYALKHGESIEVAKNAS